MGIFDLQEDEQKLQAFLSAEFGKAFDALLPKLEAIVEQKLQAVLPGIEASLETKLSAVLADQLGVSRDIVTKTITDALGGKLESLPGDLLAAVESKFHI